MRVFFLILVCRHLTKISGRHLLCCHALLFFFRFSWIFLEFSYIFSGNFFRSVSEQVFWYLLPGVAMVCLYSLLPHKVGKGRRCLKTSIGLFLCVTPKPVVDSRLLFCGVAHPADTSPSCLWYAFIRDKYVNLFFVDGAF